MKIEAICVVVFLAASHFCDANPNQDKLEILDKKFRTRFANQPTAFVFGERVTEGVELGCYGYMKGGAPHRVFYSYDAKDYRLINIRNMKFVVHPSRGSTRFAVLEPRGTISRGKMGPEVLRFPDQCL